MSVLDGFLGSLFIATVLSTILFGILTVQTHSYFCRFPKDPKWVKFMVCALWLADFAHQVGAFMFLYEYMIWQYHVPLYMAKSMPSSSVNIILEPIPAFIAQCYYSRRMYLLNPKWWPVYALTVVLAICAFGLAQASGIISWIVAVANPRFDAYLAEYQRFTGIVTGWLITCCICDIIISSSVAYHLWKSRTGYKPTDRIVTQLIVWTMSTGMLSAAVALFDAVTFVFLADTLVYIGANIVLAKLYSNSVLAFLNRRNHAKTSIRHIRMSDFTTTPAVATKSADPFRALDGGNVNNPDNAAYLEASKQQVDELNPVSKQEPVDPSIQDTPQMADRKSIHSGIEISGNTASY